MLKRLRENKMSEEFSKEQIQVAADYINEMVNPILLPGIMQLPLFEHTLKKLKKQISDIVSAAAIIGTDYRIKERDLKYRAKRIEALINFLKAYKETEKEIGEIKNMKDNQNKINELFGIN